MGNIDTKLSPYYSIIEEKSGSPSLSKTSDISLNDLRQFSSLWTIRKVKFSTDNKNSLLFELNPEHVNYHKHLKLALNQIKCLKTIRHPNIVKYLYSKEPPHSKCILITEPLRPLTCLLNDLSREQIVRGLYGITNGILFLHEKVKISHNNICTSSINLNPKQTWKLNNFELSMPFSDLNSQTISLIYEFKDKNSVTPEEELVSKGMGKSDFDSVLKEHPHCLDSYAWAMLVVKLLYTNNKTGSQTNIIDEEDEDCSLEDYLSHDPRKRPQIRSAIELQCFDVCKNSSFSASKDKFDPLNIQNLTDLESNVENLIVYLNEICKMENKIRKKVLNENLIDFLLSPIMFFSQRVRENILPSVLIPIELNEKKIINNFYLYKNWNLNKEFKIEETCLQPLIDLDKYKAFVLPRILSLFTMRSMQIRTVLLECFPFYIHLINDVETLKYEILPELLVGLKEKNDNLVSLTFSCLAIMVKLLGHETVVGKSKAANDKKSYFTENIPKTIEQYQARESNSNSLDDMNEIMKTNKVISDSMIALHDETESDKSFICKNEVNEGDESSSEWLNDWDQDEKSFNTDSLKAVTSASLISLQGSINTSSSVNDGQKFQKNFYNKINDNMGAEFDIKSIKIEKKKEKDPDQDLIDSFLNEIKPNLESKKKFDVQSLTTQQTESNNKENLWHCDDEINFDEL